MELPIYGAVVAVARAGIVLGFLYVVLAHVWKVKMPGWFYPLSGTVLMAVAFIGFNNTYGPRFVLSGESGIAPAVEGSVKSNVPDKMTDQERLQYNQDLYTNMSPASAEEN